MTTTTDDTERARDLGHALHEAAVDLVAALELIAPFAYRLAALEATHRAALAQAGEPAPLFSPRALAVEVALHALSPLTPYLRMVTAESAARARELLLEAPSEGG